MPIKVNISEKGKSWKLELADESLFGKSIGEKIDGKEISADLAGYDLEITGGSDISGFPLSKDIEGIGLKKLLLKKGFSMRDNYPGIRRRKTLRGKQISQTTTQLNIKVIKAGSKPLAEIFPDQNKAPETAAAKAEAPAQPTA